MALELRMVDIHRYKRSLELKIEKIKRAVKSEANKKLLLDFCRYCLSQGISEGKVVRYLDDIEKVARWTEKELQMLNRADMEDVIIKLEQSKYTEWTKYCFKVSVRKFFKWMRNSEESPPEVKWIKFRMKSCKKKLPEDLLTEEEVKKMITSSQKERDRALLCILYESGCRISEILTLKIKHASFDKYGAVISVSGKSGARRVRLILSVGFLQEWVNKHPFNDNPDAYLWIKGSNPNEILGYARARNILKDLAKEAGIKKKVNPHNFRHSRASLMANHLTEAQLKEVFGWTQSSRMASVYVHLSGKNTDDAILKIYGKTIEEKITIKPLAPKQCVRCKTENETTNKFCKLCGNILDEQTHRDLLEKESKQQEANNLMNMLMNDKEVLELLAKKLRTAQISFAT